MRADRKKTIPICMLQKKTVNKLYNKDLAECKHESSVYSVDTRRGIAEVAEDLEKVAPDLIGAKYYRKAVSGRGFTVMNTYDLRQKLSEKVGDCLVFEVGASEVPRLRNIRSATLCTPRRC